MKKITLIGVIVAIVLGAGCATGNRWGKTGGQDFPKASDGYKPTKVLTASKSQLKDGILNVVNTLGVSFISGDASLDSPATTDFIEGPSFIELDILFTRTQRYKITFSYVDQLKISVVFEQTDHFSMSDRTKILSDEKAEQQLKLWVFEKIEEKL